MTHELLLAVHLEVALAVVDHYLVVHGLPCEVLPIWMHCSSGYGLHIGLAYVFGDDWYAELPQINLLIICSAYKAAPILDEGDCVDASEVLFILLNDFTCVCVILYDLLVRTPC